MRLCAQTACTPNCYVMTKSQIYYEVQYSPTDCYRVSKKISHCFAFVSNGNFLTHGLSVSMYVWMTMRMKGTMRLKINQTSIILM